jgi:hypothetical protein
LTSRAQVWLGSLALMVNVALYWRVVRRASRIRAPRPRSR